MTSDLVVVATDGDGEGFVYAFGLASGDVRWKHHLGRRAPSDVVGLDELIYVNTEGDSLVALDHATGEVRWRFAPPDGARLGSHVSSPIIVDDRVVIAGGDGVVYALDGGDGRVAWQQRIGVEMTSPVAAGDLIYVGIAFEDRVIALAAAYGSLVAEAHPAGEFTPYMHPVVTERGLSMVTGEALESWTADLSRLEWRVDTPAELARAPVVWGDRLVGGTVGGHLVRYSIIDGQREPIIELKGVVTGLACSADVLYVGTQEGTLSALRP